MYFEHFGLARPPFEDTTNPAFFFAAASARTALAEIGAALEEAEGLLLLVGAAGAGKSMLGRVLEQQIGARARVVHLAVPSAMGGAGNAKSAMPESIERKIVQLVEAIHQQNGAHTVVIVDRAENLAIDDLAALRHLGEAVSKERLKVHVVLLAEPAIEETLKLPAAKRLAQHIRRIATLEPLAAGEIGEYLQARLRAAGDVGAELFTRQAVERLAAGTSRLPREVNGASKRAMIRAAARGAGGVEAEDVEAALGEMEAQAVAAPEIAAISAAQQVAPIAARLEQALANGPQQLRAMEIGLGKIREEANRVVTEAQGRLERAASVKVEVSKEMAALASQRSELDSALKRAAELHRNLSEAADRFAVVEDSAQERIGLLMGSLDAAQGIYEKLQTVRDDAVALVDEAQQASAGNRERLEAIVEEIGRGRMALAAMIGEARRHEENFEKHRDAIGRQLEEARTIGGQTLSQAQTLRAELQAASNRATEEVCRLVSNAAREDAEARRQHAEQWNREKAEFTGQMKEIQAALASVRGEAERVRHDGREMLATTRREIAEECARLHSAADDIQTEFQRSLAESKSAAAAMHKEMEAARQAAKEQSGQLAAIIEASNRTAELVEEAQAVRTEVSAQVAAATEAGVMLQEETEQAVQTRHTALASVEAAIKRGEQRIAEGVARLELLTQTEQAARESAAEALAAARAALVQVNEAQQRMGQAQQAAIDVEAAAVSTRASVQAEIKRAEESLRGVASTQVDKAQAVINGMVDDAARTARQSFAAIEAAATSSAKRIGDELTATAAQAALEHEAARVRGLEAATNLATSSDAAMDAALEAQKAVAGARAELTATMTAMQDAVAAARQDVRTSAMEATADAGQAVAEIRRTLEEAGAGMRQIVERGRAESEQIGATLRQAAIRTSGKASEAIDAAAERAQVACDEHVAAAVARTTSEVDELTASAQARTREMLDEMTIEHLAKVDAKAAEQVAAGETALRDIAAARSADLEQAAQATSEQAMLRVSGVAQSAAQAIQEQLAGATEATRRLHKMIRVAKRALAEAAQSREQVDNSVRDVLSLTATTDQRVQALTALAASAERNEGMLAALLARIEERGAELSGQTERAARQAEVLSAQKTDMEARSGDLGAQIQAASGLSAELKTSHAEGVRLIETLTAEAARLGESLETARQTMEAIVAADAKTRATAANLAELASATTVLDGRVNEIQQGVAQPLTIIQNARSQAEELNEICLGVKRVFRGVSQASVEAGERMNMLRQLLGATEKAAHTMKQWVEEANRARDRLATTLSQAPSIHQTHPSLSVPEIVPAAAASGARRPAESVNTAVIERLLRPPVEGQSVANQSAQSKARLAMVAAAAERAESDKPAAKQIEPLIDVLKAKAKAEAEGKAAKGELAAVGAAGAAKPEAPRPSGNRLRPDDVRAMIEEARKRS